jgi:hypothetical protein
MANPQTKILALDLGTQTGWALQSHNGIITSGTQSFKPQRFEGGGMRFLRFQRWLEEIKGANQSIGEIIFEEVRRHKGVDASHIYGGWLAILGSWCEANQIPFKGVPVATIKKFATGNGNANKPAMIKAIVARGYSPADDNEADALALLHWGMEAGG